MPLPEYANFYTRRDVVEDGVEWLDHLKSIYGLADPARVLLEELRAGLERSRHREALARIQAVVGPLKGDALEALADRLEELAPKMLSECPRPESPTADGEALRDIPAQIAEEMFATDDAVARERFIRRWQDKIGAVLAS